MYLLAVSEKILSLICEFGILQGLLLSILIYFHPRGDKSVNIYLALYILCTSAIVSLPFLIQLVGWKKSYLVQPVSLLSGPLLYFYIRSFKETLQWRKIWPHLLWVPVVMALSYWNMHSLVAKYPDETRIPAGALRSGGTIALQFLKPVQQITYFVISFRTLQSYRRSIRQLYSETSYIDLGWVRFLLTGFLVLVLSYVLIFPLIIRYPEKIFLLILINMVIAVPYIYIATVKGLLQSTIWQTKPDTNKKELEDELTRAEAIHTALPEAPREKTGTNNSKTDELAQRIIELMEDEKLYQEPELTLQQLATRLDCPQYQVSLSLNEGLKKNFYDLVNGYRVEEAKRLLLDPGNSNFTILSVGFEAGFNSKTTFNTVFKKFTGLTPTEFRNKQRSLAY